MYNLAIQTLGNVARNLGGLVSMFRGLELS